VACAWGCIEAMYYVQAMVWCSDVVSIVEWRVEQGDRWNSHGRVGGEPITSYRPTSSRSLSFVGLSAVILRMAIAADRRT
jgi:hypothetical protein